MEVSIDSDHAYKRMLMSNAESFIARMRSRVTSGQLAEEFGSRYSPEQLEAFVVRMNKNVQELVPNSVYTDPERLFESFIALKKLRKKPSRIHNEGERYSSLEKRSPYIDYEPVYNLKNFLTLTLYNMLTRQVSLIGINTSKKSVEYKDTEGNGPLDNHFKWETKEDEKGNKYVEAVVSVADRILPVAQEEYFHAAQELSFGNVDGLEFLDPRISMASNHITHSSIILDRILSSAAAEMGPEEFSYWADKADSVTAGFRKRYVRDLFAPWSKTPLGKEVNKRFQYPLVDYSELGAMLVNFTRDMEGFLFAENGELISDNQALIDIISLQFGSTHKDITYQLLDFVDTRVVEEKDFERIGREITEWGKKLLQYYKGKPEEQELVTHHTHIENEIHPVGDQYESYLDIVTEINASLRNENAIPTTVINLKRLARSVYERHSKKIQELLQAVFPENPDTLVQPDQITLKRNSLSSNQFRQAVEIARHMFNRQNEGIKTRFERLKSREYSIGLIQSKGVGLGLGLEQDNFQ